MGMHVVVATPTGFEFNEELFGKAQKIANANGGSVIQTNNPIEAVENADAIYTDVWTSMGQEEEAAHRLEAFKNFQINDKLVSHAKKDYMFLHCLPAHREEEVAASVIDGPNSYVFQQAGNRLHAQKAVLAALL